MRTSGQPVPVLTFIVPENTVNILTGDVRVHWPSCDTRSSKVDTVRHEAARAVTLAFIEGYRAGNPTATDADVSAAVLEWAAR